MLACSRACNFCKFCQSAECTIIDLNNMSEGSKTQNKNGKIWQCHSSKINMQWTIVFYIMQCKRLQCLQGTIVRLLTRLFKILKYIKQLGVLKIQNSISKFTKFNNTLLIRVEENKYSDKLTKY